MLAMSKISRWYYSVMATLTVWLMALGSSETTQPRRNHGRRYGALAVPVIGMMVAGSASADTTPTDTTPAPASPWMPQVRCDWSNGVKPLASYAGGNVLGMAHYGKWIVIGCIALLVVGYFLKARSLLIGALVGAVAWLIALQIAPNAIDTATANSPLASACP
jgi:hypothetical protein